MSTTLSRLLFSATLATSVAMLSTWSAPAAAEGPALTPQQQKMSTCAKQNKGKKGDDYKQAQKACLSGDDVATASSLTPQHQKMASCSKANKGKKGDEFKQAQKACLAG